jgi:hypothetical protein
MHVRTRTAAVTIAVGAVVSSAAALGGSAAAAPQHLREAVSPHSSHVTTVGATATVKKITLTRHTIPAGPIVFDINAADQHSHTLQVARLRNGYSLQQANKDLKKAFRGDIQAIRTIDSKIVFRGGATAKPGKPGSFGVDLSAGKWFLLDQSGQGLVPFTVKGQQGGATLPKAGSTITAFSYGFGWSGDTRRSGLIHFVNRADQPHFLAMLHVASSVTDKTVRKYFKSGARGRPSWQLGGSTTSGVLSPGASEEMSTLLPAGKYLIACFWPDMNTGMPHAFMGMWKLITVSP